MYRIKLNVKTEQDCVDYLNTYLTQKLDMNKPLYEFQVLEDFSQDKSVIFLKFHHSFTDGIGMTSLWSCILDECLTAKFPKQIKIPSIFDNILLALVTPYFVYKSLTLTWDWKTDPVASKCKELKNDPDSYKNQYLLSREISLDDVKARCKKKKIGFTPYMLGLLSKSFYQWFEHYDVKGAKEIAICIVSGLRNLPKSYEEINLNNN